MVSLELLGCPEPKNFEYNRRIEAFALAMLQ